MTKIFLKQLASTQFSFFNEDSIKPEFREDFVEWYEQHVTVMNILELPMNPKTGEGFYPAYDVLRLKNIGAENVDAGAVADAPYEFIIQTESDATPVSVTILGQFIPTYADLIRQLTNNFPNVVFSYNKATETNGGTHSITVASRFPAEEPEVVQNDNGGTSTTGISAPSTIEIIKFGNETTSPLTLVTEVNDGQLATHPPIELAPILPQHILVNQVTGSALSIIRGAKDELSVPNQEVDNIQDVVDYINEKFGDAYAYVYQTYDSPIPTYLDGATSAYEGDPLVFGIIVQFPIPGTDALTTDPVLPEDEFRATQEAQTFFATGNQNFVRFVNYEQGIGNEFTVDKSPHVANGIWLFDVLVGTEIALGAGQTWIADAITPEIDDRHVTSVVEILKKIISSIANPLAQFGRTLASAGVSAGKIIKDLAALAADGVLAAAEALAKLTDAAIGLTTGVIANVADAITDIGSAVVGFITERVTAIADTIAGWFENPPSIDDKLDAAVGKIDNPSIAPYIPVAVGETPSTASNAETTQAEDEAATPITDEGAVSKPLTTNPQIFPPFDNDRGGLSEA